ncbi:hypothetical protein ACFSQD_17970 [Flavihumibacter stibioxidans]|uniref:PKD/Chitinase domain-containing protein n=1 Tax=Flavihumibacter stibioxidans TaxID=1834163 RepID=A0ABR7MCB7_9BACT|nr:hypothetical protein [Flavihumibacter stibioxidans]MBC6492688.1 hypothetical protein [Flavihumibacter stibioxidans]
MIRFNLYSLLLLLVLLSGCKKESFDEIAFAENVAAPDQLSAMFNITQDNSGKVSIYPNGKGIAYFLVHFGDGNTSPQKVLPGKSVDHIYAEGNYNVRVLGIGVNGLTSEATQALTVSFRQPENLDFTVAIDPSNPFQVNLTAKADFETLFRVYFGETVNEDPQSVLEGNTLSYTYAKTGTYTIRVVALSGGSATSELTKTVTILNPLLLPLDFEAANQTFDFINFDGGLVTVIDNPKAGGLNTSPRVGRMVKNAGQPWGGSVIALGQPIDFSANKVFRMKVYSPRVGAKVLLKVENISDGGINFEKEVSTTVANSWEDLAFDYSAINTANSYQKIVLIFELGTVGDGSENFTFYFDDIRQANSMPGTNLPISLPVSFDDPSVNYTVTDFGGNNTVDGADPVNAANKVKITTKPNGAETWAGVTIGTPTGFASAIPLSATATKMSVRVYSPAAGIPVLLKIEDHTNGNISVETLASTTVANAWETLVFDFANHTSGTPALDLAKTYDKASIFFDFGNAGSGKQFYWDDVQMAGGGSASLVLPLDFQSPTLTYAFVDFDGGQSTVIDNPFSGGINTSSKVGKMVKNAGQPWGGSFITLDAPIDFSVKKTFKVKVYSPRAGAKLLLKVENKDNGALNFEKEVATTKANEWEELSFDYAAINTANVYNRIVLIFDLGTPGDGSANFTFYFDDITLN